MHLSGRQTTGSHAANWAGHWHDPMTRHRSFCRNQSKLSA